jgi:asparagine synthase (glutamine-hydrolysing)
MCGIVGILDSSSASTALEPALRAMSDVIVHRGPDDDGLFVDDGIALGMRRLSIIDLEGGRQPIWNEDRSVVVVFNGEIYNYRELRAELQQRGHTFATHSDTEVIVHLYEEQEEGCLEHLRGMFAFALYDLRRQKLFIARDRMGIKPLYYHQAGKQLLFASEIKSLLAHPSVPRAMNHGALFDYLTFKFVPAPKTLFEGIHSLPPGHSITVVDGEAQIKQYWDLSFRKPEHSASLTDSEALERLSELFRESVRLRLRSDVPFGAFLSGGIDSSLIVALMTELLEEPVKTFSVGFETAGSERDELPYARIVAERFGTDHHEVKIKPDDFSKMAERVIWHMDQPIADQATVATFMLSKLARQHVKMVLTGEGGDELFAGYARYAGNRWSGLFQAMPRAARQMALALSGHVRGQRRAKIALHALCQNGETARFANWFPLFNDDAKQAVLGPALDGHFAPTASHNIVAALLDQTDAQNPLDRMLYVDSKAWLPDYLLLRGDKLTMANSLEARVPLLDHKLVEFAASLPAKMKLRRLTRKFLLRKMAARHLPHEIIDRKKQGFPIPINEWFRGDGRMFVFDLLADGTVSRRGLFNPQQVERLKREHTTGAADHSNLLWGLASIELWQRLFLDAGSDANKKYQNQNGALQRVTPNTGARL